MCETDEDFLDDQEIVRDPAYEAHGPTAYEALRKTSDRDETEKAPNQLGRGEQPGKRSLNDSENSPSPSPKSVTTSQLQLHFLLTP